MSQYLNSAQQEAVAHNDGPCMVIAGPGAGKTRVITQRIIRLIQEGIAAPYAILALTFTKKAAQEMQKRIAEELGQEVSGRLWIGTFHSLFSRILRIESEAIGLPTTFTIYDTEDSKALLRAIIDELKLDAKTYVPNKVLWRIGQAKKRGLDALAYAKNGAWLAEDEAYKKPHVHTIFTHYQARCQRAAALDFDDILLYIHQLFKHHPDILARYQKRFAKVLVDEFQDTNALQYGIVRQLVASHQNLFVVGDDAQSIYAFQGAQVDHMLAFKTQFPTAKIIKLEQNYRSTKYIVQLANGLIQHNTQHPKKLFTENEKGERAKVSGAYSEKEEARLVVEDIFTQRQQHQYSYNEFAIIYRTNRQSRYFEEALRKANIPYRVVGGMSFYERKEVKDFVAYLRILVNPNDEQAIKRAINMPKRGIGSVTFEAMHAYTREHNIGLWESLKKAADWAKPQSANRIMDFVSLIETHQEALLKLPSHKVAQSLFEKSGLKKLLAQEEEAIPTGMGKTSREENVGELITAMQLFESEQGRDNSLAAFLQEIALFFGDTTEEEAPKVTLITAHKAKGLEWRVVYAVGMNEEVFPSWHMLQTKQDIEEERRLFFVVLSRAQKRLTITYSTYRFINGNLLPSTPSRFIKELDKDAIILPATLPISTQVKREKESYKPPLKKRHHVLTSTRALNSITPKKAPPNLPQLTATMQVRHPAFGQGRIVQVNMTGPYPKVEIEFNQHGRKTLLLQYARLDILDKPTI